MAFPERRPTLPQESAFPYEFRASDGKVRRSTGMTLREQFAMAAMQGLLSNHSLEMFIQIGDGPVADRLTATAVRHADALIAELAKEKPNV